MQAIKIKIAIATAAALAIVYLINFPNVQYFKCEKSSYGSEWEEAQDGKRTKNNFSSPEYLTVRKYIFGLTYAIDGYQTKECEKLDDTLMCQRNEDFVMLQMISGEMSKSKKSFDKHTVKNFWQCEQAEKLVK